MKKKIKKKQKSSVSKKLSQLKKSQKEIARLKKQLQALKSKKQKKKVSRIRRPTKDQLKQLRKKIQAQAERKIRAQVEKRVKSQESVRKKKEKAQDLARRSKIVAVGTLSRQKTTEENIREMLKEYSKKKKIKGLSKRDKEREKVALLRLKRMQVNRKKKLARIVSARVEFLGSKVTKRHDFAYVSRKLSTKLWMNTYRWERDFHPPIEVFNHDESLKGLADFVFNELERYDDGRTDRYGYLLKCVLQSKNGELHEFVLDNFARPFVFHRAFIEEFQDLFVESEGKVFVLNIRYYLIRDTKKALYPHGKPAKRKISHSKNKNKKTR